MKTARMILVSLAALAPVALVQAQQPGCEDAPASDCSARCGGEQDRAAVGQDRQARQRRDGRKNCNGKKAQKGKQMRKRKGGGRGGGGGQGGCGGGGGHGSVQPVQVDQADQTQSASAAYVQRLQDVLKDELYARDFYLAAAETSSRPRYGNLARAEARHADAISAAIRSLGGEPVLEHGQAIDVAKGLADADGTCREIELKVIALYEGLIEDCPDPALVPVLEHIQQANYRHLNAVGGGPAPVRRGPDGPRR